MDMIAANTPKELMLQFDVGTCVEAGQDPIAWINANPGRINSLHLKDWAPARGKGYKVLFGEGDIPVEENLRRGGVDRRRRVLPDRAGRQPLPAESRRAEKCLGRL